MYVSRRTRQLAVATTVTCCAVAIGVPAAATTTVPADGAAAAGALSSLQQLGRIPTPSYVIGPTAAPESGYTVVRKAESGQPTIIFVGGADDENSIQQLNRFPSLPGRGVGIVTIDYPAASGVGIPGLAVFSHTKNAFTYQQSVDSGAAAIKRALIETDADAVVGISLGSDAVLVAVKQLAAEGKLPPNTAVVLWGAPSTPYTGMNNNLPTFATIVGLPGGPISMADSPARVTNVCYDIDIACNTGNVVATPVPILINVVPGFLVGHTLYNEKSLNTRQTPEIVSPTYTQVNLNTGLSPWTALFATLAGEDLYDQETLDRLAASPFNKFMLEVAPVGTPGKPAYDQNGKPIPTINQLTGGAAPAPVATPAEPPAPSIAAAALATASDGPVSAASNPVAPTGKSAGGRHRADGTGGTAQHQVATLDASADGSNASADGGSGEGADVGAGADTGSKGGTDGGTADSGPQSSSSSSSTSDTSGNEGAGGSGGADHSDDEGGSGASHSSGGE